MGHPLWRRRASLATGLVVTYIAAMTAFNIWKPRILILHSLSESLRQVQETDAGLREPLKANRLPISLRWFYLNADQATPERNGHPAMTGLQRVIEDFNPTVLVAVDDDANGLLAHEPKLWQGRRLFFLGINRAPVTFGYSAAAGATGIRDQPPLHALAELFGVIRPDGGLRIAVLGSDTPLGRDLEQGITAHRWAPQRLVFSERAASWPQWQAAVQRANRQADILLITSIAGLQRPADKGLVPPAEVVRFTEASSKRVLPVGLMVDYVPLGGSLGIIPSARYLGNIAMTTVLRWLEPSRRSGIPAIHLADHFDVGIREQALRRRGIELPMIYREAARLSGQLIPAPSGLKPQR
jgi:hypothetical protein